MKKILLVMLFSFFLSGCGVEPGNLIVGNNTKKDKYFKGVELYSWLSPEKTWSFSLLIGTNRIKNKQEVMSPENEIKSITELKRQLSKLAEGESVFWHIGYFNDSPSKQIPNEILKEIKNYTRNNKVELVIFP